MAYELGPDIEQQIKAAAARESITIEELLRRTFAPAAPVAPISQGDTEKKRVANFLHKMQKENGLPPRPDGETKHTPLAELAVRWDAEDAHLTDEEWEAERKFWEEYEQGLGRWPVKV